MATPELTGQTARCLDAARATAARRGHAFVGTEHLLLALATASEDSFARRILDELDVTVAIRERIEAAIGSEPG